MKRDNELSIHFSINHVPWKCSVTNAKIRELSICTMDGFCDGKTSNAASSPQRLSGPLRIVELGGLADDKFNTCAHDWNWHPTVLESSVMQIKSSLFNPMRPTGPSVEMKNSVFEEPISGTVRIMASRKEELHVNQNWECCVCYLKIINTFLKHNISNLTHIVWETQKWHNNFRRVKVRSCYAAIASLRCRTAPYCTEINVTALRCRMKVKFNLPWNAVKLWWLAAESNRYIGTAMQVVWTLTLSSRRAYVRRHKKPSVLAWGVSATPWGNRPISQLHCVLPSIKLF